MVHWTVEKMLGGLTSPYETDFEPNYVDAETTPHPSNNAKIAQMLSDAYWAELTAFFDEVETYQNHYKTMTGVTLTNNSSWWGVGRLVGESDSQLRVRFAGRLLRLMAKPTPDAIEEFVESFIGASPGQVLVVENTTTGVVGGPYEPASFYVTFDFSLLEQVGIPPAKWPETIAAIDGVLDFLAAAGVYGRVLVTGGAVWDDPEAIWDDADTVWGS